MLGSTADGQLQSEHEYKQQQYESTEQNKEETTKTKKNDQFRL
jgi:hypothetical protein